MTTHNSYSLPRPRRFMTALCAILTMALMLMPQILHAQNSGMKEYEFNVGQFKNLKVQDNVNVVYRCVPDTTAKVVYTSDPDFADAFIFTNSGGTLKIQVTTDDVGKPGLPTIYVYSDYLQKVENYSDFHLKVENPAPCPEFAAYLIGNGSISVSGLKSTKVISKVTAGMGSIALQGTCTDALFRMTGTGTIQADRLQAENVTCKILGGGSIGVDALNTLKVGGLGSTKIYYSGSPEIKHSGGGKLFKSN